MSITLTLQRYLTAENIQYDVIPHDSTMSPVRTAEACRISGAGNPITKVDERAKLALVVQAAKSIWG